VTGDITFNEFLKLMLPVFTGKFDQDSLYFAFKKFDLNNTGYISAAELRAVLAKIGQNYSEKEIENMIKTVDRDGDGKLSFQGIFYFS
jgi:calmodulin